MGYRILIVDDSAAMRAALGAALRAAGHAVVEASDGADALRLAALPGAIDLILADLNMPVMDGLQFTRLARSRSKTKTTPIVILTTEGKTALVEQAKAVGASGWITKPCATDQLLATIARLLG